MTSTLFQHVTAVKSRAAQWRDPSWTINQRTGGNATGSPDSALAAAARTQLFTPGWRKIGAGVPLIQGGWPRLATIAGCAAGTAPTARRRPGSHSCGRPDS